mgnify:CR=1 FL=1
MVPFGHIIMRKTSIEMERIVSEEIKNQNEDIKKAIKLYISSNKEE